MEPNLRHWLKTTDKVDDNVSDLIDNVYKVYQADLEESKEKLAEFYGN